MPRYEPNDIDRIFRELDREADRAAILIAGPLIGYARVSIQGQDLAQQRATLCESGCTRLFKEKVSGAKRDRPELGRLLDHLRAGDVVRVTRLDRLARSTRDLLEIAERIKEAGAVHRGGRRCG